MKALIVLENPQLWPLEIPGTEIVPARDYLRSAGAASPHARVFNFCRSYGYQTVGYYVSLLAAARGHRPLPSVTTLTDLRIAALVRLVGEDLEELIEKSLGSTDGEEFELRIYFGRGHRPDLDPLARALFGQYPAPFLRARFARRERWEFRRIRPIAASEIPEDERELALDCAREHFRAPRGKAAPSRAYRYDLAILRDPAEVDTPSDDRAIARFIRAGRGAGLDVRVIDRDDLGRIAEFDALFLRETTYVNHHTFRFARKAVAEGLVVIDDPESILRCTNKVYQAEIFVRHGISSPRTLVVDAESADGGADELGLPCVLKRPDSSFSQGVVKAETPDELAGALASLFVSSELAVMQEFLRSDFDWRIGVLGGRPLWACKYFMARGHWQIIGTDRRGGRRYGKVEALPVEEAPAEAVRLARQAAGLIGDGLYGVDLKEVGGRFYVMEINDSPNVDAGYEDAVLGDRLYEAIMEHFRDCLDRRGTGRP